MDQTGTLDPDAALALRSDELDRFYMSDDGRDRTKPVFFLIVPNTGGAHRPLCRSCSRPVGREGQSGCGSQPALVVARDGGKTHIATGAGLSQRIPAGAAEQLVAEIIEPGLRSGELLPTLQKAAQEVEGLIDAAAGQSESGRARLRRARFGARLADRRFDRDWNRNPLVSRALFCALVMAGWSDRGLVRRRSCRGGAGGRGHRLPLFVLVGLSNWVSMALSVGSGGSGGGGGFSGGAAVLAAVARRGAGRPWEES